MTQADVIKVLKKLKKGEYLSRNEISKKIKNKPNLSACLKTLHKWKEIERIYVKEGQFHKYKYKLK